MVIGAQFLPIRVEANHSREHPVDRRISRLVVSAVTSRHEIWATKDVPATVLCYGDHDG